MTLALSLAIFLPKILIGFAIADMLWKERTFPAVLLKLAIGVPLGFWFGSSLFFLSSLAGIPPRTYSWIEFWTFFLIMIPLFLRMFPALKEHWKDLTFSWETLLPFIILLSGLTLSIGAFLFYARLHPYGFEDAWSIWNITARFLYRSNSADLLLNSDFYRRFHPDYPVELGLNVAWGWFVVDSETTRVPIAVALLSTLTPVLIIGAALHRRRGMWPATLGALVLAMTPDLPSAVGQYADALVALHMLAAAVIFCENLRSPKTGLLLLAGLLAGSSAWVKNEGLLFLAVLSVVCILAAWKRGIQWNGVKWFFIGSALPLTIVLLYKLTVSGQNDLFSSNGYLLAQFLDLSRWQVIGWNFASYILDYGNWPISVVVIVFLYAMLAGPAVDELSRSYALIGILLLQLAGYFGIYLITPHDLQLHIDTSMARLISHVFPLFVLWMFTVLRSPDLKLQSVSQTNIPPRKNRNGW